MILSEHTSVCTMSRVVSKNLFNFLPSGVVAEDVAAHEAKVMAELMSGVNKDAFLAAMNVMQSEDEEVGKEFLVAMRGFVDTAMKKMGQHPVLQRAAQDTLVAEIKVPTTHDGNYDVPVSVYTPKALEGASNAAVIYAHGGGAVASNALDAKPWLDYLAVACNVVVFNVEYRLAPETKCPNNVKDFYETVKYIHANATFLGVDSNKICIAGDSGGGYICLGTMVLLAQRDETALVRLAIPGIPMVDDYCFSDPACMTEDERAKVQLMRKIWKLIATDFSAQRSDPLLFPGKASDDLLAKFPPTVIREVEFDMFITEATRLARRLQRVGRLLELVVIPGAKHGSCMNPELGCFKQGVDVMKTLINEYLHSDSQL